MSADPSNLSTPAVLAIGHFDGVHLGHQAIFRTALAAAREHGGTAGCLTFSPHAAVVLAPEQAPLLLATPAQNRAYIEACGIASIHVLHFTRELAALEPAGFINMLRERFVNLREITVGSDFTFGRNRAGNADTLPGLARAAGLTARILPHVAVDGAPVSSTRIRAAVGRGDMIAARTMLGRSFALAGKIIRGQAVARTLGFPTANLAPHLPIRPAPGVYAARLILPDGAYPGASFIPDTADPRQAHFGDIVEIHVPGFERDLYGQEVEISFTARLRAHQVFADSAAAIAQIGEDVRQALAADAQLAAD
ncbi:MAG: riboflavin biosynthesis protein RibF [Lentisphaerae bacterium]|jgi:riboflavin kinase/FMN adenylyltransferase|nr:riboflavin biosynthesis protein RibF [Lentisphaerota bacterium]